MTYTLAAVADAVFLVAGWLFLHRFVQSGPPVTRIVSVAITPLMFVGIVYMIAFLAMGAGLGCPNGHWTC